MKKLLYLAILLIGLLAATTAQAFDCASTPLEEAYAEADLVAVGRVLTKEYQGTASRKKDKTAVVTFELSQVWKGSITNDLVMHTNDYRCNGDLVMLCSGETFEIDRDYLIYAKTADDGSWGLSRSMCGRTRVIEYAEDDLKNLDAVSRQAKIDTFKQTIYQKVNGLSPITILAVAIGLSIGALGLYCIRTRKK